jgi:metal-dependent amidase/aminoacylase/carboxypeptidase family protein
VLRGAAATHGCELELKSTSFDESCLADDPPLGAPGACTFPPTVNHPRAYELAHKAASALAGAGSVRVAEPVMGGEDFAYFLEQRPGAILFLGSIHAVARPRDERRGTDARPAIKPSRTQSATRPSAQTPTCTRRASKWTSRSCPSAPHCTWRWRCARSHCPQTR